MPLPFTKQRLSFMSDHNLQNLEAFSLLVNMIPNGEAWLPIEEGFLWDVHAQVLRGVDTDAERHDLILVSMNGFIP